jgi:hypothetical protein
MTRERGPRDKQTMSALAAETGFSAFLLDAEVSAGDLLGTSLADLEAQGFDVIEVYVLDASERHAARAWIAQHALAPGLRDPAVMVATLNLGVQQPGAMERAWSPDIDDVALLKRPPRIEARLQARLAEPAGTPLSYACRSAAAAADLLARILPGRAATIAAQISHRRAAFRSPFPVVRPLGGLARRSRVELVEYAGGLAVCKTFRPGRERFLRREVLARTELRPFMPEVSALLEHGSNWLLMPFHRDTLRYRTTGISLLPLAVSRAALRFLGKLYDAGYAHLDFSPGNLIIDRDDGLRIIDFEFLHRYSDRPASFEQSYDLVGLPPDFDDDRPAEAAYYANMLQPHTGLSIGSLMHGTRWHQHLERSRHLLGSRCPRQARRQAKLFSKLLVARMDVELQHRFGRRLRPAAAAANRPVRVLTTRPGWEA